MNASSAKNKGNKLGSTWSPAVTVNAAPARSTVFPEVTAGAPGHIAISYMGADSSDASENVADSTPWHVYTAFSDNALCGGSCASFQQSLVTRRVTHYGNICTGGLGCTVSGKDRSLLDFFDIGLDENGHVGVVFGDNNNSSAPAGETGPVVKFAKVVDGPNLLSTSTFGVRALSVSEAAARAGDARFPLNAPEDGTVDPKQFDSLDVTGLAVGTGSRSLTFAVDLRALNLSDGLDAGYMTQHVKYVVRWEYGRDIYFAAADTDGGEPTFYGGKVDDNDAIYGPFNADTVFGSKYVQDFPVTGTISDGTIAFTVPSDSIGSPKDGRTLYSVQAFTVASPLDALVTLYTQPDVIDESAPLDYVVGSSTTAEVLGSRVAAPNGPLPRTGLGDATPAFLLLAAAALVARGRRATSQV